MTEEASVENGGGGVNLIERLMRAKGRPARIDSGFYQAKLQEGAAALDVDGATGLDRSLLLTVKKINFVGADDLAASSEMEQIRLFIRYPVMLTNLMDEARQRKAPMPVRAPAQICVATVVAAELLKRGFELHTVMDLMERLLEQLELAVAFYLDETEAKGCSTLGEMICLLRNKIASAEDGTLASSASLVLAFSGLLHGLVGIGDLPPTLAEIEEKGADGLWYFLEDGYRFFGLPPAVCQILEAKLKGE